MQGTLFGTEEEKTGDCGYKDTTINDKEK